MVQMLTTMTLRKGAEKRKPQRTVQGTGMIQQWKAAEENLLSLGYLAFKGEGLVMKPAYMSTIILIHES